MALGNLTANLTGLSLILGVLSAFDTLAPQAFGAKRFGDVGILAQRGLLVSLAVMGLTLPLWLASESLLASVGQPPLVCKYAAQFLKFYTLGIPAFAVVRSQAKFLNAQNIAMPIVVTSGIVSCIFHPIFLRFFITYLSLGTAGAALATGCSQYVMAALNFLVLRFHRSDAGHKPARWRILLFGEPYTAQTWPGLNLRRALQWDELLLFLQLAGPGILGNSEWWLWEVVAFMAGVLGAAPLAAHGVAYNILPLAFMFPLGVSIGLTVRVASLLGEGRVAMAHRITKWASLAAFGIITTYAFIIFLARDAIIVWFSTDAGVVENCRLIWGSMCIFIVVDGMWGVQKGPIVALGLQMRLTIATVASLWCLGLPLMWYLAFREGKGLLGLWQGVWPAYLVFNVFLFLAYYSKDWAATAAAVKSPINDELPVHEEETS